MEVKLDVVRPNVIAKEVKCDDNRTTYFTHFSLYPDNFLSVCRDIGEIVSKHIGELKVMESDLEVVKFGRSSKKGGYNVSLKEYLTQAEKTGKGVTSRHSKMLELSYLIDSKTYEDDGKIDNWRRLQFILSNPEKLFDESDEKNRYWILDRRRSLEEMQKTHKELDSKIPNEVGWFKSIDAEYHLNKPCLVGRVSLLRLKAKDDSNIDNARLELIERLQQTEGPCLLYDTPNLFNQLVRTFVDARKIVENYGDVLLDPNWQRRFFRYDPRLNHIN